MKLAILRPMRRSANAGSFADGTVNVFGKEVDLPIVIVGSIVAFIVVDRALNRG